LTTLLFPLPFFHTLHSHFVFNYFIHGRTHSQYCFIRNSNLMCRFKAARRAFDIFINKSFANSLHIPISHVRKLHDKISIFTIICNYFGASCFNLSFKDSKRQMSWSIITKHFFLVCIITPFVWHHFRYTKLFIQLMLPKSFL